MRNRGGRQEWLRASIEVQRAILASNEDSQEILQRIAENALRLANADVVSIVRPSSRPDQLEVAVAVGIGEEKLQGLHYPTAGSLAWEAMTAGHGMIGHASDLGPDHFVHLSSVVPVGPVMTSPLIGEGAPRGAIVVGRRPDGKPFTRTDLDVTESFANQAALALELADSRADQQRLTILEDRDRIARDLHDHVIQRLFATGLSIQAAASMMPKSEVSARLRRSVEDLDETIKQIRTSIFQLRDAAEESSLRNSVLQVVEQAAAVFGFTPRVQFDGPLDTAAQPTLVDDVQAVVREALTNAAKYAHATEVEVRSPPTSPIWSSLSWTTGQGWPTRSGAAASPTSRHAPSSEPAAWSSRSEPRGAPNSAGPYQPDSTTTADSSLSAWSSQRRRVESSGLSRSKYHDDHGYAEAVERLQQRSTSGHCRRLSD